MGTSNKSLGSRFEDEFAKKLHSHGFWVHRFAQSAAGQPADIIAVRNGEAYLIDCKLCSDAKFSLSRIEENQRLAMESWDACGNGTGWFALKLVGEIYMLPYVNALELKDKKSALYPSDLLSRGVTLKEWFMICK